MKLWKWRINYQLKGPNVSHPESTKYSVFHHSEELFMAQAVVPVQVKDLKNCVQNVLWKVMACRYLHCSLKLSYGAKNWGRVLCISVTRSIQFWPSKNIFRTINYLLLKFNNYCHPDQSYPFLLACWHH